MNGSFPPLQSSIARAQSAIAIASSDMEDDLIRVVPSLSLGKRPRTSPDGSGAGSPASKLFSCGECSKSYSRVDHLARHVKLHTRERPYICDVCGKSFARVDLLKRHAAGHNDDEKQQTNGTSKASSRQARVSQACEACAEVHLKCDNEKPCKRCRTKDLSCQYPSATADTLTIAHDLLSLAQQIDEPESSGFYGDVTASLPTPITDNQPRMLQVDDEVQEFRRESQVRFGDDVDLVSYEASRPTMSNLGAARDGSVLYGADEQQDIQPRSRGDMNAEEFHDFMQGVIGNGQANHQSSGWRSGTWTPWNLFDFGAENSLETNEIDLGFLDDYAQSNLFAGTPDTAGSGANNTAAETSSEPPLGVESTRRWRFRPDTKDTRDANLSLPATTTHKLFHANRQITTEPLSSAMRDKVLAMIVSAGPQNRSVLSFPSVELLDSLLQYYLSTTNATAYLCHAPTFNPNHHRPELCAAMIAAGAVLVSDVSIQKLGWAIQETLRLAVPNLIEGNNALIRDIELLQAAFISLKIGLWSGNSRKIEIAESFMQPYATMIRRAGWFGRKYEMIIPEPSDEGHVLEDKWRRWLDQERQKRIAFFVFQHDSQASMTLFINPNISYAELSLPLPRAAALWNARTAHAWKMMSLSNSTQTPSLIDLLQDIDRYYEVQNTYDHDIATQALLSAMWGLIREYRQQCSITSPTPNRWNNGTLLLSSRLTELKRLLECLFLGSSETPSIRLLLETLSMHLHMSLEEVYLFAGVEGHEEAKRVYPKLREWVKTSGARQAVWHAGQVIRHAKTLRAIRDYDAVAVYQASLAFWSFGVIFNAVSPPTEERKDENIVLLTEAEDTTTQRFIALDRGRPAIVGKKNGPPVILSEPSSVMAEVIEIVKHGHSNHATRPPLVNNLLELMDGLREAVASRD